MDFGGWRRTGEYYWEGRFLALTAAVAKNKT
jgi:hypothetical protein